MRTYTLPVLALTFTVSIFLWMLEKWTSPKSVWLGSLISFILALGCGGFNETFTAVQFTLIASILFLGLFSKKIRFSSPVFFFLFAALMGTFTALTIMFIVPGRANRQSFFTTAPSLMAAFTISIKSYLNFLQEMIGTVSKTTGIAALIFGTVIIGTGSKNKQKTSLWLLITLLLVGFLLAFVCFIPAAYSMSEAPPTRTLFIPSFLMMTSLMMAGYTGGQWLKPRITISSVQQSLLVMVVFGLLFFSAWINATNLYSTRSKYIDYAKKWDVMNSQILQARDSEEEFITIPRLNNWARLEEPNDNPKYWVTVCYSAYYDFPVFGE